MKKIRIQLATAAVAVAMPLALLAALAPDASAATTAPATSAPPTSNFQCDQGSTGFCLDDAGDSLSGGTPIDLNNLVYGRASEDWSGVRLGTVGGLHPFNSTLPYNTASAWQTDAVFELTLAGHSNSCLSISNSGAVALEGCNSVNSEWVVIKGGQGGYGYVSVSQTDAVGSVQVLNGNDHIGTKADTDTWVDGEYQNFGSNPWAP